MAKQRFRKARMVVRSHPSAHMRRFYSRLATVEERKNVRSAFILILLTVTAIVGLIMFGLPTVAKFASFVADLRKGNQPVDRNDATPPAPPTFNQLPEATNKQKIDISGNSESGTTITLLINNNPQEVVVDSTGTFRFSADLNKGQNTLWASAKDKAGNESQKSKVITILFDNEAPNLDISEPNDGQQFNGAKERQITIKGKTEPASTLTINDRLVKVEDDGSFIFATTLNEGDNSFNFKAVDTAGNNSEKTLTVHFSL